MIRLLNLQGCSVDLQQLRVKRDGETVTLTAMEARLLAYLVANPGRVVSQEELLREVWDYHERCNTQTVRITVSRLRSKIERDPSDPVHLRTVVREGYRWEHAGVTPAPPWKVRTSFVGRRDALAALSQALDAPGCVTVLGPAGIGKTRLTLEYLGARAQGETCICDLSSCVDEGDAARAIATTLRVGLASTEVVDQVSRILASLGESLVVLDNFEQLPQSATDAVERWLAAAPELRMVVTSRRRLGLLGERVLELDPLPTEQGVELFLARSDVSLDQDDGALHRIVQKLDGLPLAIELAAPWCALLSPDQLEERLEDRFALLRADRGIDRHRTLRAALDGSWELLDGDERDALVQAAVFRGGFTVEAAEAVVHPSSDRSVLDLLRSIHGKSLVQRASAKPSRFHLLESTRLYVTDRIDDAVRRRHAACMLALAEELELEVGGPNPAVALRRFVSETDNLLAALRWTSDPGQASALLLAMTPLFATRGPATLHLELIDRVLALAPADPVPLLRARGDALRRCMRLAEAREVLTGLAERTEDPALRAQICMSLGMVRMYLREGGRAEFARAAELARTTEDLALQAVTLRVHASALRVDGELGAALALLQEAATIQERQGFERELALTLLDIGELCALSREPVQARHYLGRAQTKFTRGEDVRGMQIAALRLGESALYEDEPQQAVAHLTEMLELSRRMGSVRGEAQALWRLGDAHTKLGALVEADEALAASQRLYTQAGSEFGIQQVAEVRAIVALRMGDHARGEALLEQCVETMRRVAGPLGLGSTLQWLALARWLGGHTELAAAPLEESVAQLEATGRAQEAAVSRVWLAALRAATDLDEAEQQLSQAREALAERDRWLMTAAEAHLARLRGLPHPPVKLPNPPGELGWVARALLGLRT